MEARSPCVRVYREAHLSELQHSGLTAQGRALSWQDWLSWNNITSVGERIQGGGGEKWSDLRCIVTTWKQRLGCTGWGWWSSQDSQAPLSVEMECKGLVSPRWKIAHKKKWATVNIAPERVSACQGIELPSFPLLRREVTAWTPSEKVLLSNQVVFFSCVCLTQFNFPDSLVQPKEKKVVGNLTTKQTRFPKTIN